jgi:hypothetical protein
MDEVRRGRPLAVDRKARSASATEPAFVARPEGAPSITVFLFSTMLSLMVLRLAKLRIGKQSRATREMHSSLRRIEAERV